MRVSKLTENLFSSIRVTDILNNIHLIKFILFTGQMTDGALIEDVFFTQSFRGRPSLVANGDRYLVMSQSKNKILWRCNSMATDRLKCPARITQLKSNPPRFYYRHSNHLHASLKRGKYCGTPEIADQVIIYSKKYSIPKRQSTDHFRIKLND